MSPRSYQLGWIDRISRFSSLAGICLVLAGTIYFIRNDYYSQRVKSEVFSHLGISQSRFNDLKITSSFHSEDSQDTTLTLINIPAVGVQNQVITSKIIDGEWEISETEVNHLASSALPGESGNIVLYGHNHYDILGNIRYLEEGKIIELTDSNDNSYHYSVSEVYEVDEEDLSPVAESNKEILTIYTCTDLLGTKRAVVKALPVAE